MKHQLKNPRTASDADEGGSGTEPLKEPLDRAGRIRRKLLAITLSTTALIYMSAEAMDPKGTDQIITTKAVALKVLPIAARHSRQLYVSGSISEIALAALAVSYFAIATLVRHRDSTLATVAAIVGAVGAFCGIVTNVLGGINLAAASTAHLTKLQAARFLTTSLNSSAGKIFADVFAFSEFLAPILMFVALWRSRLVPRWLSVLFVVGLGVAEQTASVGVIRVIALMALFAIGTVLLSVRVWRSAASSNQLAIETRH